MLDRVLNTSLGKVGSSSSRDSMMTILVLSSKFFVVDLAEVDKVRTAIPIRHQKRHDVYETWDSNNKC